MRSLLQIVVGSLPVNRINHHLTGERFLSLLLSRGSTYLSDVLSMSFSLITSFQKHRLYDTVSFELFHSFDDLLNRIFSVRTIQQMNVFFIHRIQFQDIIIYLVQCFEYGRTVDKCRVTQYAYFLLLGNTCREAQVYLL